MKSLLTSFLLLSVPCCLVAQSPTDTLRYAVLINGQPAGKAWVKDGVLYDSKKLLNSLSIHHYSEP